MDRELRSRERRLYADGHEPESVEAVVRQYLRSGRLLDAYKALGWAGLLKPSDGMTLESALAEQVCVELAKTQRAALERLPEVWSVERLLFPWPHDHSKSSLRPIQEAVGCFPIEGVHVYGELSQADLETLATLPWLRFLNGLYAEMIETRLDALTKSESLESLVLPSMFDLGPRLAVLVDIPRLSSLELTYTKLSVSCFEHITAVPKLKFLSLINVTVSDYTALAQCEMLRHLEVENCHIELADVQAIAQLTGLQTLEIHGERFGSALLKMFEKLTSLLDLRLSSLDPFPDQSLDWLAKIRNLEALVLCHADISTQEFGVLPNLPQLKTLGLSDNQRIDSAIFEILAQCPSLESLSLQGTQVTDAKLQLLARCSNLKSVDLSRTQVSDRGLKQLADSLGLAHCLASRSLTPNSAE